MKKFEGNVPVSAGAGRGIGRGPAERPARHEVGADGSFQYGDPMVADGGHAVGLPLPGVLDQPLAPDAIR